MGIPASEGGLENNKAYEEAREKMAELEHEQWIAWSQNIADNEDLSPERIGRWRKLWVDYKNLTDGQKDQDRKWADKILSFKGDGWHLDIVFDEEPILNIPPKATRRGIMVLEGDPMYEAILARRDLEGRTLK